MIAHLAPGMCDLTLLDLLENPNVDRYTVNHMRDLADMRRIQAFCDALELDVRWQLRRNPGEDMLHILSRPDPQLQLEVGA